MESESPKRVARSGIAAVVDQGLFAGANLVVTVLLARWLSAPAFGAFAVAFTLFLFVATLHNAVLVEPMLVFGPGRFAATKRSYLRWLLRLHAKVCVGLGAGLAVLGILLRVAGWATTGSSVIAAGVLLGPILFYWLLRRVPYVDSLVRESVRAGLVNLIVLVGAAVAFQSLGWLTPPSAFLLYAVSGAASGALLLGRAWRRLADEDRAERNAVDEAFRTAHRRWAPWATGTAVAGFIPGQLYFLVLPIWHGLAASGELKALMSTVSPVMQATAAISIMLLPRFVRASRSEGFVRRVAGSLLVLSAASAVAWVLIGSLGAPLLDFLYAGKYTDLVAQLWILGALPVLSTAVTVGASGLRSLERPKPVLGAYVAATLVAFAAGVPLTVAMGLPGAIAGLLAGYGVNSLVMWILFGKIVGDARRRKVT